MPMTREEQDIITQYVERVSGRAPPQAGPTGSVPATIPQLPPVDPDADRLIGDLFMRYPEAKYRLTQTAFVQEHALVESQNRIQRLEWEMNQMRQALAQAQQSAQQSAQQAPAKGGFFSSIFGGGAPARPAGPPPGRPGMPPPGYPQQGGPQQWGGAQPPPPQYPPGYQQGMFNPQQQQRGGSGFLGSALTTAAGVAGGLVVGSMLMNAFSGHGSGMGGGSGAGAGAAGAGQSVDQGAWSTPDDPSAAAGGGAWGGDQAAGGAAGGAWGGDPAGADPASGGGWADQSGGGGGGGWDDNSGGGGGGGWDSGGGGSDE